MSQGEIHYFGIRHHGPGSAARLVSALNQLQPKMVLIEGPADCSELLPSLAHPQMKPPVALLSYAVDHAENSIYYPFVDYSPEYQATRWAIDANAEVAFIDLPANIQLAQMLTRDSSEKSDVDAEDITDQDISAEESGKSDSDLLKQVNIIRDPIGELAHLAGYEDGEAWWNDLIEQNKDDDLDIFQTVELAMTALRSRIHIDHSFILRDQLREAYMRLEIIKYAKKAIGPIAVVCGAWHVPALKEKHRIKDDTALIKTLPPKLAASKFKSTWVPWTTPRLASVSGYGAGVDAPMWYEHLWQFQNQSGVVESWLGRVTKILREAGQVVSTASVIEAVRLSTGLAVVRGRPAPGFEEIRESIIACLCFGEALIWQQLEQRILLGNRVGEIPADSPLVPLLEDLQQSQKKLKLKPEALASEITLDLRSNTGLEKSVLLHRLTILDVPWGTQIDAGGSRGTFRERWRLCWQPEYAVKLVENLVYGSRVEQAADNKMSEVLQSENNLSQLALAVQLCLAAKLSKAVDVGLRKLDVRAAHASDCIELLDSLPPLININRYGSARKLSLEHIAELVKRLATQASLSLAYSCRNLNDEEAGHYRSCISSAHDALQLLDNGEEILQLWWSALNTIVESSQSNLQVAGLSARLLYLEDRISASQLHSLLQKMFSPAIKAADAARFFDGFFSGAVGRLLYDSLLLNAVNQWLMNLEEATFVEFLPLFRRIFSDLDLMERKRLLDTAVKGRKSTAENVKVNMAMLPFWATHLEKINKLVKREKRWTD